MGFFSCGLFFSVGFFSLIFFSLPFLVGFFVGGAFMGVLLYMRGHEELSSMTPPSSRLFFLGFPVGVSVSYWVVGCLKSASIVSGGVVILGCCAVEWSPSEVRNF